MKIDPITNYILEQENLNEIPIIIPADPQVAAILAGGLIAVGVASAIAGYAKKKKQFKRQCEKYKKDKFNYTKCRYEFEIKWNERLLQLYKKALERCNDWDHQCKRNYNLAIKQSEKKITKYKNKIRELEQRGYN